MNNNIVAKDKRVKENIKYMYEELERAADLKEKRLNMYDRMMKSKSEIDISKCKGRD